MAEQLELFRLLHNEEMAEAMGKILLKAGIPYEVKRSKKYFDPSFAFNAVDPEVNLLLRPEDFSKANHVLRDFYAQQAEQVDEGYYLLSFSDNELIDIIRKPDEWGSYDVALAKRILHERGIEISDDVEVEVERERLKDLARPVAAPSWMVIAGYVAAFLGGFFGIMLGWMLGATKVLPDGSRVPVYRETDRKHGRSMMTIGAIVFTLAMSSALWVSYH